MDGKNFVYESVEGNIFIKLHTHNLTMLLCHYNLHKGGFLRYILLSSIIAGLLQLFFCNLKNFLK